MKIEKISTKLLLLNLTFKLVEESRNIFLHDGIGLPGYSDCESLCRYDRTTGKGQIQARYVNLSRVLNSYAGNY